MPVRRLFEATSRSCYKIRLEQVERSGSRCTKGECVLSRKEPADRLGVRPQDDRRTFFCLFAFFPHFQVCLMLFIGELFKEIAANVQWISTPYLVGGNNLLIEADGSCNLHDRGTSFTGRRPLSSRVFARQQRKLAGITNKHSPVDMAAQAHGMNLPRLKSCTP